MNNMVIAEVFMVAYDGYNQEFELVRQGFVTMYDTRKEANKLVSVLNEIVASNGKRLNFYVTCKSTLKSSLSHFRENENLSRRIEEVLK